MSTKFQLKNGLKVLLVESHRAPVVSVQMWVRTGSADERQGEEGLSHFIEHLLFKGTRKYKTGEIAALIEGSGGELNAYTSFDQTVFYITISKHFSHIALNVINEMMGHPTFDSGEIDNEREVVIEEIRQGKDNISRVANQKMFSTVFKKHPYGIPVIGYERVVQKIPAKKIKQYFTDRYSSQNMFLVVAGDFESKEMKAQIQKIFSDMPAARVRKVKRKKEPAQTKPRIKVELSNFVQAVGSLTWRGPAVTHKDVPALDVLVAILGQGDSSRLVLRTRVQRPLVNGISTYCYSPKDPGICSISFNFEIGNEKEILTTLREELLRICITPPSKEEMQKVMTNIASEQIYALETVEGMARNSGSFEFYFHDSQYFTKYLNLLYRLQPIDITRIAKKYFNPKTLNISILCKRNQSELNDAAKRFLKDYTKGYSEIAKSRSTKSERKINFSKLKSPKISSRPFLEPEKINLKSGVSLLFKSETDTPTVSVKCAYLGGLRSESPEKGGISELFGRCFTGGSSKYSEEEINYKIDSMASAIGAFSGRNSCGLNMDFLSIYKNEMFDLYQDILTNPAWSKQVIEREKEIICNQLKNQNDKPASLCGKQFMRAIFADHPYSRDMLGEEESVRGLCDSDLREYFNKLNLSKNMTICIVGDLERAEVIELAESLTKGLQTGNRFDKKFSLGTLPKDIQLFRELQKEQTHIMVGYRGLTLTDPDRYVVHIINAILSGQGGRLFMELRDKNSLAYSVYPTHMEGIEGGYFAGYISCAPDKAKKSIEMLKAEFSKMADHRISEEELARAKQYLIGGHDIDLQRKSSICSAMLFDDIYGIDYRASLRADEKYSDIHIQDVQRVAAKIFEQKCVTSVVGSESPY